MEHPTEQLIPTNTAFADAMTLLAIAADPKAADKRLGAIRSEIGKFEAAALAAEKAQAALAQATAEQNEALTKRTAELDALFDAVAKKDVDAEQKLDLARTLYRRVADMEGQMTRAVMTHADLMHGWNERLQTLPSLKEVMRLIDGVTKDAHDDEPVSPAALEPVGVDVEAVPDAPAGSTLTRQSRARGIERRVT